MTVYAWWVKGLPYAQMAATSLASVGQCDPDAHRMIYLDEAGMSGAEADEANDVLRAHGATVVRGNLAGLPHPVANTEALWRLSATIAPGTPMICLDADIIVLRPMGHALGPYDDAFFTWRSAGEDTEAGERRVHAAEQMPYNSGVYGVCMTPAGREFFVWLRERILRMAPQVQEWYGDQMALAELLGRAPASGSEERVVDMEWVWGLPGTPLRAVVHPCSIWNFTPAKATYADAGQYALHFKGESRPLMGAYAKALGLPFIEPEKAPQ